jgi:hypothetical protein
MLHGVGSCKERIDAIVSECCPHSLSEHGLRNQAKALEQRDWDADAYECASTYVDLSRLLRYSQLLSRYLLL